MDMMKNGDLHFIINTPSGHEARIDEVKIRSGMFLPDGWHAHAWNRDYAWFTADEARQLLPQDEELVDYMENALDLINMYPPETCLSSIDRLVTSKRSWRSLLLEGAIPFF